MTGQGWSEASVHAWLSQHLHGTAIDGHVRRPIHDAAVLPFSAGLLATCCDRTEEGVHFTSEAHLRGIAHKAVGRSLSDLAATAAEPVGMLLALSAPKGFPESKLIELLDAVIERGAQLGAPLLGGDLTASGEGLSLVVTAIGRAPEDPPGRDRLQEGDVIVLTGPVGGSRIGRHLWIEPRLALGRQLHAAGARAMMDVSDGLALDLSRLARSSDLAIDLLAVCVHPDANTMSQKDGRSAFEHALFDGEDHELLAGVSEQLAFGGELPGLWPIGRVRSAGDEAAGLWLADELVPSALCSLPPSPSKLHPFDPVDARAYLHGH